MTDKVLDLVPVAKPKHHKTIYDMMANRPSYADPAVAIHETLNEVDHKLMLFFQEMNALKWKYLGNDRVASILDE